MKAYFAGLVIASVLALVAVTARPQSPPPAATVPALNAAQLDQLVAPIALYPDPLVAQILMAATYPLEVVQADRWLQVPANAALNGDALTTALQQQPWDPSVKSLIPFPQVLRMMDDHVDWTEKLGDAFLAQQADVMDSVQRLRQRAAAAGSLTTTPQQTVATQDQEILVEPAIAGVVYVPVYVPWCVYGTWPYPAFPPYYFGTWPGYCAPAYAVLAFGAGIYPPFVFWAWGIFDWRHHLIRVDHDRYQWYRSAREPPGGIWEHDPSHRHGVPYRDPVTAGRFLGAAGAAQRDFRGFPPPSMAVPQAKPTMGAAKPVLGPMTSHVLAAAPLSSRPAPPAFESFGAGAQVRGEAARGLASRQAPAAHFPGGGKMFLNK